MNEKEINQHFLCLFSRQVDGLVYLFLRSIAQEGIVQKSGYALSKQLGIFRTTLSRILHRMEQQQCVSIARVDDSPSGSHLVITLLLESSMAQEMNPANVTSEAEIVTSETEIVTSEAETVTSETEIVTSKAEDVTPSLPFQAISPATKACLSQESGAGDIENATLEQQKKSKEENPPAPQKEEIKRKNSQSHARERQQSLEMRKKAFVDSLSAFTPRYGSEMINAFADYWTEPDHAKKRMRFEMQKTWSTALRLSTWARNEVSFGSWRNHVSKPSSNECVSHAQQWAMEESTRIVREAEDHGLIRQKFLSLL